MAASNKRREDEGIAMFDVVEFDGPGVGACATTSATTRHNSTAISVGGDVFVPAHVHTCICICIRVPRGRANGRPVERRKRRGGEEGKEERGRLAIDSYFIIIINSTVISFIDELRSFLLHEFLYKFVSLTVAHSVFRCCGSRENGERRTERGEGGEEQSFLTDEQHGVIITSMIA